VGISLSLLSNWPVKTVVLRCGRARPHLPPPVPRWRPARRQNELQSGKQARPGPCPSLAVRNRIALRSRDRASREMLRHQIPLFRVWNRYRSADCPTCSATGVYQNVGWSVAKFTSRNVQVKLVTVCNSPSGVGLTLIVQARLTAATLLKLRPTPAEGVTNGDGN
jgi:hypothetical protein